MKESSQAKYARRLWVLSVWLTAGSSLADTIEERSSTMISQQIPNTFQTNPAAVPTKEAIVNAFQYSENEESNYLFNPGDNQVAASHTSASKDLAIGGQLPLGGAAVGYHFNKNTRTVTAKNEQRGNRSIKEEFSTKEQKVKFVVDLTPEFRAAFGFRFQSLDFDVLGSHNLSNEDHTRFSGNRTGYSLGFFYQIKSMGIGLYTNPPLRGKVTIVGEQKIISDPGSDGLEFILDASERLKIKLAVNRWLYKKDDRDDDATSPIDQRGILLRGLDIDQYFRKTQSISLGSEFFLTNVIALKASITAQQGVFLFDQNILPNKNEDLETKLDYKIFRGGVSLRAKEFLAEFMLTQSSRESDLIRVRRGDVNLNSLGNYESKLTSVLISLGAAR